MSSRLQLDMRNLSLGRRHLVNAYEVEAGIGVIAGNTVWSMPECLECEVLQKARYINALTFYSYHTNLQTRPVFWTQLHTSQVSCLPLQTLQRYHANEILLTQQNKYTYRHLSKYSQPLTSMVVHTRTHDSRTGLLTHTDTDIHTRI